MDDSFQWDDNTFNNGSDFGDYYQDVPYSTNFYDDYQPDQSYAGSPDSYYDNPFNIGTSDPNYSIFQDQYNGDYLGGGGSIPSTQNAGWGQNVGSSIQGVLKDLFTKGTTSNMVGQVGSALMSGYQNNQKAKAAQKMAGQVDPWASQRSFYQQQAQQAVTDPYSSPIVKAQIEQMQNAQNIKDAAAGRRSNQLTSSPALMAEMAKVAQNYQAQMAQQGGSNINPSGLAQILQSGSNSGIDGYASPIANLFGNQTQSNTNQNYMDALQKFFK